MNDDNVLERLNALTVDDYVRAFKALCEQLTESDIRLLRVHYAAPEHVATATELARGVGFANYNAVNLRYGLLGKKFLDYFGVALEKYAKVNALVTLEKTSGEWEWTLRPQVVEALSKIGLV